MQMRPFSSWTAWVTFLWRFTSLRQLNLPPKGASQPRMLGAMPPVTIRPTPPRARSAKYAASLSKSAALSSRPVCMEPINTRLGRVQKPRSSGFNRCGYGLAEVLDM